MGGGDTFKLGSSPLSKLRKSHFEWPCILLSNILIAMPSPISLTDGASQIVRPITNSRFASWFKYTLLELHFGRWHWTTSIFTTHSEHAKLRVLLINEVDELFQKRIVALNLCGPSQLKPDTKSFQINSDIRLAYYEIPFCDWRKGMNDDAVNFAENGSSRPWHGRLLKTAVLHQYENGRRNVETFGLARVLE